MDVLVIGGSGFIGSRLIEVLTGQGHRVRNLDLRTSARFGELTSIGDVRDIAAVEQAAHGCDAIVNLAAEHRDDVRPVSLYQSVNVDGAAAVVKAAEAGGVQRIVFTSTVAVYGLDKRSPTEQSPLEPFNEYGRTKAEAEQVLTAWAAADPDRSLTIVRPSVVFGEGNRGNVYTLARQIATRRFLIVGNGRNRKSMGYVGNVAAFLASCLAGPAGTRVINYADKPDLPTRELVSLIRRQLRGRDSRIPPIPRALGMVGGWVFDLAARATGRTFPISAVRIRKFCAETTVDTSVVEASGFQRHYSLPEALRRTLEFEFPGGRVPAEIGEGIGADS